MAGLHWRGDPIGRAIVRADRKIVKAVNRAIPATKKKGLFQVSPILTRSEDLRMAGIVRRAKKAPKKTYRDDSAAQRRSRTKKRDY